MFQLVKNERRKNTKDCENAKTDYFIPINFAGRVGRRVTPEVKPKHPDLKPHKHKPCDSK